MVEKMVNSKRFFIITGPPGVGKTTLVKKLCRKLADVNRPVQGFFTDEVRENGVRSGFDVVTLSGDRSPLARVSGVSKGPTVGKYTVDVSSFEKKALPLLLNEPGVFLVIDEIGKMELLCGKFKKKIEEIINSNQAVLLATIPVEKGAPIPLLTTIRNHPATMLFEVTRSNRDSLTEEVLQIIQSS